MSNRPNIQNNMRKENIRHTGVKIFNCIIFDFLKVLNITKNIF